MLRAPWDSIKIFAKFRSLLIGETSPEKRGRILEEAKTFVSRKKETLPSTAACLCVFLSQRYLSEKLTADIGSVIRFLIVKEETEGRGRIYWMLIRSQWHDWSSFNLSELTTRSFKSTFTHLWSLENWSFHDFKQHSSFIRTEITLKELTGFAPLGLRRIITDVRFRATLEYHRLPSSRRGTKEVEEDIFWKLDPSCNLLRDPRSSEGREKGPRLHVDPRRKGILLGGSPPGFRKRYRVFA